MSATAAKFIDASSRIAVCGQPPVSTPTIRSAGNAPDYRDHKLQASAVCWLTPRHGLQAGVSGTLDGVSALQERAVFAAFWYRF